MLIDAPNGKPDVILLGTGSELHLAVVAHEKLSATGVKSRVVSLPCFELFDEQPQSYRDSVLPPAVTARVAVESGVEFGWERYLGLRGRFVGMHGDGASAPGRAIVQGIRHHGLSRRGRVQCSWRKSNLAVPPMIHRRGRMVTMVKYFLILVAVLLAFDTLPAAAGRFRTRGRYANSCTGVRQPVASASAENGVQRAPRVPRSHRPRPRDVPPLAARYPAFGTDVMLGSHRLEDLRDPFRRQTRPSVREGGEIGTPLASRGKLFVACRTSALRLTSTSRPAVVATVAGVERGDGRAVSAASCVEARSRLLRPAPLVDIEVAEQQSRNVGAVASQVAAPDALPA